MSKSADKIIALNAEWAFSFQCGTHGLRAGESLCVRLSDPWQIRYQKPPIHERPTEALVEDLCFELRHIACSDYDLPRGERVVGHVREVAALQRELHNRGADLRRLEALTSETNWQMLPLLHDWLGILSPFHS